MLAVDAIYKSKKSMRASGEKDSMRRNYNFIAIARDDRSSPAHTVVQCIYIARERRRGEGEIKVWRSREKLDSGYFLFIFMELYICLSLLFFHPLSCKRYIDDT